MMPGLVLFCFVFRGGGGGGHLPTLILFRVVGCFFSKTKCSNLSHHKSQYNYIYCM